MRMTDGGRCAVAKRTVSPPSSSTRLSWTILVTCWAGGDALGDLAANGALAHRGDELAGDAEVDVGLEECHADLAQGGVHVLFGQAAAAAEVSEDAGQALGQAFKHEASSSCEGLLRLYGAPATGQGAVKFRSIGGVGLRSARGIRLAA